MTASASHKTPVPSAGRAVRTLIVDDSSVIRGLLTRWIGEAPGIEVVGSASNGEQAIKIVSEMTVDVVVLDIEMPVMDGITALPKILTAAPGVKIVMSSTLTRRNAEMTMRALRLGAADTIAKPETIRGVTTSEEFREELVAKIKALGAAARSGVRAMPERPARESAEASGGAVQRSAGHSTSFTLRSPSRVVPRLLAIGASTGGPQALFDFFTRVGPFLTVPVVITQHMPATFTAILAEHLSKASGRPAKEGETGDMLRAGHIYVAPGGKHMLIERRGESGYIRLDDGPQENFCKPAVDPMFRSIAETYGAAVLAMIFTGMGHDGREGARALVGAGATLLAQDAVTSIVWGMPGAVAEAGLCSAVLPLGLLPDKVRGLLKGTRI